MATSVRRTLAVGAVLFGVLASGAALATATIALTPSGPFTYNTNQAGQTLSVNFSVSLGGSGAADDVMVQFDNFIAYDPNVLKYKATTPIVFGSALSSLTGTIPQPSLNLFNKVNYTAIGAGPLDASITDVGVPVEKATYYDGSLHVKMVINNQPDFDIADLLNLQDTGPALLFTIVFDVVTTQIGNSAIVLLNDTSFATDITPPTYDSKYWNEGTPEPFYPTSNVLHVTVETPAPTPLALIAGGLIGMASRWRGMR